MLTLQPVSDFETRGVRQAAARLDARVAQHTTIRAPTQAVPITSPVPVLAPPLFTDPRDRRAARPAEAARDGPQDMPMAVRPPPPDMQYPLPPSRPSVVPESSNPPRSASQEMGERRESSTVRDGIESSESTTSVRIERARSRRNSGGRGLPRPLPDPPATAPVPGARRYSSADLACRPLPMLRPDDMVIPAPLLWGPAGSVQEGSMQAGSMQAGSMQARSMQAGPMHAGSIQAG